MARYWSACFSLLGVAVLMGCVSPPQKRFPDSSDAGRRACIEEVQANYAPQGRVDAMKRCLESIDQRLQAVKTLDRALREDQKPAPTEESQPSVSQRFAYCRLHQQEIQEAERERQRLQSVWLIASTRFQPDSNEYQAAKQDYEAAISALEELIPLSMRADLPLIPDAVQAFLSCNL